MRVFVAEKPSVGRAIAANLPGPQKKHKTYIECGEMNVVVWCAGHILTQAMPEEYDEKYKRWSSDDLPIIPDEWRLNIAKGRNDLYKTIKRFLGEATMIVHAGDPDREGQLLVDEVLERIGYDAPVKRILISDLNAAGVKRAMGKIEDNEKYHGLRDAALGRSRADWLYGLNLTRLYTVKGREQGYDGVLSVGRVQTPVLGLVVRRDDAIENFTSIPFYQLSAEIQAGDRHFTTQWVPSERAADHLDPEGRAINREYLEELAVTLEGQPGDITSLETSRKRQRPPLPFSLADLQKAANKGRGLSAKKTLEIAQALYEKHQVLTYPRSDCAYLPLDHHNEGSLVKNAIVRSVGDDHALVPMANDADLAHLGKAWNDAKVTAHHAIIPTTNWVPLDRLTADERWIYELVAHRYLLQFMQDRVYDQTQVVVHIDGAAGQEQFKARGTAEIEAGWTSYKDALKTRSADKSEDADSEGDVKLPPGLGDGQAVVCSALQIADKKTTPPKRFTEATLLDAMTGIAKFVEDPVIKQALRETDGLGTPATQATIIETLFKRGFIEKEGKSLRSTSVGRQLIKTLPESVTKPDMTAHWEMSLSKICEGAGALPQFMADVTEKVTTLTAAGTAMDMPRIEGAPKKTRRKSAATGASVPCPGKDCNGTLRKIDGKKGAFWGCSEFRNGCKETRPDNKGKPGQPRKAPGPSVKVGATCPDCKKGKIQQRTLKQGNNAGKPFLGCSAFPTCKFFQWPRVSGNEGSDG